jgi:hypothetical protein
VKQNSQGLAKIASAGTLELSETVDRPHLVPQNRSLAHDLQ